MKKRIFRVKIDTSTDAFHQGSRGNEISRILRKIADDAENGFYFGKNTYCDANGNSCCETNFPSKHIKSFTD